MQSAGASPAGTPSQLPSSGAIPPRVFREHFQTSRLFIRPPHMQDEAALLAAMVETRAQLLPWFAWAQPEPTAERVRENLRQAAEAFASRVDLRLHGFDRTSGDFVLSTGLHHPDWETGSFEIGYWVRSKYQRQGYVTEAVNGLVAFARAQLGAKRLVIRTDSRNLRSQQVALRAAFKLETEAPVNRRGVHAPRPNMFVFSRSH